MSKMLDIVPNIAASLVLQKAYSKKNTNQTWKFIVKRLFSKAFLKPYSCVGILYLINSVGGFVQVQIFMIEIAKKLNLYLFI